MANTQINIVENGTTTLATAGKYCDRNVDVVVNVEGGGGSDIPEEAFIIEGSCQYRFAHDGWNWFLEQYGDRLTFGNITNARYMFSNCLGLTSIPFTDYFINTSGGCDADNMFAYCGVNSLPSIDFNHSTTYRDCNGLFQYCRTVTSIGTIRNLYPSNINSLFSNCWNLRELPSFENLNLSRIHSYSYANVGGVFGSCYSLRNILPELLCELYSAGISTTYQIFYNGFALCYSLDELIGLPVPTGTITSNMFGGGSTFYNNRIKRFNFSLNNDGSVKTANWKNQTMDFTGWQNRVVGANYNMALLNYNSGITADKEVTDDTTYQALKDDPDWFTVKNDYSRYNHDSAVETINSLPDTSTYLATAGGTNTIKFNGAAGALTDGGAINTLTAEEIAVATAKGWTVTLT